MMSDARHTNPWSHPLHASVTHGAQVTRLSSLACSSPLHAQRKQGTTIHHICDWSDEDFNKLVPPARLIPITSAGGIGTILTVERRAA